MNERGLHTAGMAAAQAPEMRKGAAAAAAASQCYYMGGGGCSRQDSFLSVSGTGILEGIAGDAGKGLIRPLRAL